MSIYHDSGPSDDIFETFTVADAPPLRSDRSRPNLKVTIGNVDLPAYVSNGVLYVQAPLPHVFQAFAENLSEFIRDMEVRVSTARGTTFPLDGDGRPVSGQTMAKPRVVRGRGKW